MYIGQLHDLYNASTNNATRVWEECQIGASNVTNELGSLNGLLYHNENNVNISHYRYSSNFHSLIVITLIPADFRVFAVIN